MPVLEAVFLALKTIWSQKMKSAFAVIGVFIGVTFLIAVVTILQGMNAYMTEKFAGALLGVNTFHLRRIADFTSDDVTRDIWRSWLRRPRITYDDANAVAAAITVPVITSWESSSRASVHYGTRTADAVQITGATEGYFDVKAWKIEHGRAFSAQEVRAGIPVVVLGSELAEGLFEGREAIGRTVRIKDFPYRVIGVVERQGNLFGLSLDKFAIAPALSPIKRHVNPTGIIDALMVKAPNLADLDVAKEETEAVMRGRHRLRPADENDFVLETAEGAMGFWDQINQVLFVALPGLVTISLVVGGIVIMNIMLMSVSERTREIGIRKSLGARQKDIMRQFLVESATLSTVGAGLGIATGIGLAAVVAAATFLPARVAPWSIGVAVLLGAGVGIIAGIIPARRAAMLDPIVAMRQE